METVPQESKVNTKIVSSKNKEVRKRKNPPAKVVALLEFDPSTIFVFADIETETLRADCLLQIAAVTVNSNFRQTFCVYINPQHDISQSCTNFLGFYLHNGRLYRNGQLLPTDSIRIALIKFSRWIEGLSKPVCLVFHNGFSFDCSLLARFFIRLRVRVPANLARVGDTLPELRREVEGVENHKLSTLAKHFKLDDFLLHDALEDSIALMTICERLVEQKQISFIQLFQRHAKTFDFFIDREKEKANLNKLNSN